MSGVLVADSRDAKLAPISAVSVFYVRLNSLVYSSFKRTCQLTFITAGGGLLTVLRRSLSNQPAGFRLLFVKAGSAALFIGSFYRTLVIRSLWYLLSDFIGRVYHPGAESN